MQYVESFSSSDTSRWCHNNTDLVCSRKGCKTGYGREWAFRSACVHRTVDHAILNWILNANMAWRVIGSHFCKRIRASRTVSTILIIDSAIRNDSSDTGSIRICVSKHLILCCLKAR